MKKGEEEIGLRRKWGAKGDGSLKNFNQFYCCERSPGSCRGNLLGLKRSTIMIGFSLDIDLTAVFPRLSRHLPAYLATYEPVRRNIATETARDGRTGEHRALSATSWRLFKFKSGRDRSRAAVTASCSFIPCLFFFHRGQTGAALLPFSSLTASNSRLLSIVSAPGTSLEKLINVSRWFSFPLPFLRLGQLLVRTLCGAWKGNDATTWSRSENRSTDSLFVPLLFASWGREEPRACLTPGFKKCLRETRKRLCVSKCGKETKGADCCVLRSDV